MTYSICATSTLGKSPLLKYCKAALLSPCIFCLFQLHQPPLLCVPYLLYNRNTASDTASKIQLLCYTTFPILNSFKMAPISLQIATAALAVIANAHRCQEFTFPYTAASPQPAFPIQQPQLDIEVTNFMLDLTRKGHNYTEELLSVDAKVCVLSRSVFY